MTYRRLTPIGVRRQGSSTPRVSSEGFPTMQMSRALLLRLPRRALDGSRRLEDAGALLLMPVLHRPTCVVVRRDVDRMRAHVECVALLVPARSAENVA